MSTPHVIAVVATYRRPMELERLLGSLSGVAEIVVCDNAGDPAVKEIAARAPIPAHYLAPTENLGCGGGLRVAEQHAWKVAAERLTHLLVVDDDAVLLPDTVPALCAAMERENADASYPLVIGPDDRVGWLPGLCDRALHQIGREPMTAAEYAARLGATAPEFIWAQGVCLLATRQAVERAGFHRSDFWVRGEDLDFSLRLTSYGKGIFVPAAHAKHLPPPTTAPVQDEREYLRNAAMVQNIAYLAFSQPYGRRIRASLAGASRDFVSTWGLRAVPDLMRAWLRGAIWAEAAGMGTGGTFRERYDGLR